ncbi:hypothetical protein AB0L67_39720 [Streptomyces flaveolus]|uniref:hypothetical protein n=1 Tax=Streptomyces flaveolus TaxID=67297 RepID=UPI00341D6190
MVALILLRIVRRSTVGDFFCKSPGNFRISEAFSLKLRGLGLALAVVRDLRDVRPSATAEEVERFETDVLAGFVLARASVELADGTIRRDVGHLEQTRSWFGRPLWEMEPPDAVAYFGKVLRASPSGTRLGRFFRIIGSLVWVCR